MRAIIIHGGKIHIATAEWSNGEVSTRCGLKPIRFKVSRCELKDVNCLHCMKLNLDDEVKIAMSK